MKTATSIYFTCLFGIALALAASPVLADGVYRLPRFDGDALFWMLTGAAAMGVGCLIHSCLPRGERLPQPVVRPARPPDGLASSRPGPAGPRESHAMQHWVNLDEATTVTVEELSRIEEEAEVFVMTGRPDVAIKVLRDYLDYEADCRISVWFKLLDIYHGQGMREAFENLAQEIRAAFNVALPSWEESSARAESRHGLEHFPSLLERIAQHCNDRAGLNYLQELMRDNRCGARAGFHEEAFREILLLYEVLEVKLNEREGQA